MSRVTPVEGIAKPLPDAKGAADEGRTQRTLPGQTDKIRLTVAVAESYELIVGFTPKGKNSDDFPADAIVSAGFIYPRGCSRSQHFYIVGEK